MVREPRRGGSWPSPVTPAAVAAASTVPEAVGVTTDGTLWWSERRPTEGAWRLCHLAPDGSTRPVPVISAHTRVHEYGGGAWWVSGTSVFCFHDRPGRTVFRIDGPDAGESPVIEPVADGVDRRIADGCVSSHGSLVAVMETHEDDEVRNELVVVPGAADTRLPVAPIVLRTGADFVAAPREHAGRLAWIEWDHPNLPWDSTRLMIGDFDGRTLSNVEVLDSGAAIDQPRWDHRGRLWWISDADEWWNLRVLDPATGRVELFGAFPGEVAEPAWNLGGCRYVVLPDDRVVAAWWAEGRDHLGWIGPEGAEPWDVPWTSVRSLAAVPGGVVFIGASPTASPAIRFEAFPDRPRATPPRLPVPPPGLRLAEGSIATPEWVQVPTSDDGTTYAQFYRPTSEQFALPEGEAPPLVVMIHGGPTANALPVLSPKVQFWTSRGWAVADVDYRGSTGYGRTYRHALRGRWGDVDVSDCVDVARWLAEQGLVDPNRMVIRGGSAGGFTALAALCIPDTPFAAACGLYAVADLAVLAGDTHKFESRYLDALVAPWPEGASVYAARSPLHLVDRIERPVMLQQGTIDKVVPPNQAQLMADALSARGVPVELHLFDGEGHGWRQAETIERSFALELAFYERHVG